MAVSATQVKELREKTGAGMMDCKKALNETEGDVAKAVEWLREKGMAKARKRAGRETKEGLVHAYIHPGGKIGVLVEVNCETDFVARNDDFKTFVNDVAMHIAASMPQYTSADDVPAEVAEQEKAIFLKQAKESGKPDNVVEKIAEGRMKKYYGEVCLLDQPFVKDPNKTVAEYMKEMIGTIGENMQIRRFVRFQLGEAVGAESDGE